LTSKKKEDQLKNIEEATGISEKLIEQNTVIAYQMSTKPLKEIHFDTTQRVFGWWKNAYRSRKRSIQQLLNFLSLKIKALAFDDIKYVNTYKIQKCFLRKVLSQSLTKKSKINLKNSLEKWKAFVRDQKYLSLCKDRVALNENLDQVKQYILDTREKRIAKVSLVNHSIRQ
jgi:hypothetical protein